MYECLTNPLARGESSKGLNMGRVRLPNVGWMRLPWQFCWPTHAIIWRMLTIEPFDPDDTMRPRQLSAAMAFLAMSPMESLVWLSMRLILGSAFSACSFLSDTACWSTFAHACRTALAVAAEMRISPMPMENPCVASQI